MGVLIDSSVLIQHERGLLDLAGLLAEIRDAEAYLSVITVSEILHGVHRAENTGRRARRMATVEALLAAFPVLPADATVARVHALLWAELKAAGTPIGPHDTWIAATCLAYGHALVTANVREFARVPGLQVHSG